MTATGGQCPTCEQVPKRPGEGWSLYLWPPLGHTEGKLAKRLNAMDIPRERGPDGRAFAVALDRVRDGGGMDALGADLSVKEQDDTTVLAVPPGTEPGFADYPRVTSLFRLMRREHAASMTRTLTDGRIGVSFVPIAAADDASEVVAHRADLRFPDLAETIDDPFTLAGDAALLSQLDRASRVACIRETANQGLDRPVFVEFHPASIYDPVSCLRTTVAEVERSGLYPDDVIFTLSRAGSQRDVSHLRNILSYYKDRGFRVALGELGAERGALELVQHLRPEYVWLAHDVTVGVSHDPFRAVIARKLLEMAHRLRIDTVAGGGLADADRAWLYEHGVSALAMPEHATAPTIPEGLALAAREDAPAHDPAG